MTILITTDEDGDTRIESLNNNELYEFFDNIEEYGVDSFYEEMPSSVDPQYWDSKKALLIEGDILKPKLKAVKYGL